MYQNGIAGTLSSHFGTSKNSLIFKLKKRITSSMEFFLTVILYAVMMIQGIQDDGINSLDIAMTMIDNSQYEESLVYLDKVLAIDANNLQALSNKGGVLVKLKRYDEAIEYFDRALAIKPDFVEALNNKAIAFYGLGYYSQASNILLQASELDPNNSLTIKNISFVIEKIPFIKEDGYTKIEVRNKKGELVGYTEAYNFLIKYPFGHSMLMQKEWKDVEVKGQKVQQLQGVWKFNIDKTGLYARTDVSNSREGMGFIVLEILHDGFLVTEGDQVTVTLNLFRLR